MAASFEDRLPWLALGLAEMMRCPRVTRELVADAAARAASQMGAVLEAQRAKTVAEVAAEHWRTWGEEREEHEFAGAVAEIRQRLAKGLEQAFDGIEISLALRHSNGPARCVVDLLAARLQLVPGASRNEAAFGRVTGMLEAVLDDTREWIRWHSMFVGRRNRDLEDEELETRWQNPDDPLPFVFDMIVNQYIEENQEAGPEQVELFMRDHLRSELAEEAEILARLEPLGPNAIERAMGADDAMIESGNLKAELWAAVDARPLADRIERLMISEIDEVFLLALTRKFELSSPGGSPKSLCDFLCNGVRKRWELMQRLDKLGNASRGVAL